MSHRTRKRGIQAERNRVNNSKAISGNTRGKDVTPLTAKKAEVTRLIEKYCKK